MSFQLGSSLLDACVLGVLSKGDAYGYSLTQNLQDVIEISDSTTYPVLRRLKKDGLLDTYDQPFEGRNRRYYSITEKGTDQHKEYLKEWEVFKLKIDEILKGGELND